MKRILEINPPQMPNFFTYKMPPGKREDGLKLNHSIPIEEMTEEEAEEFGELMKLTFIKHWKAKKNQP